MNWCDLSFYYGIKFIFCSLCPVLFVWGGPWGKLGWQSYFSSPFALAILLGVLTIDMEIAGMLGYSEYRVCMVLNIRQFVFWCHAMNCKLLLDTIGRSCKDLRSLRQ